MAGKADVLAFDQDRRELSKAMVRRLENYWRDETFGVGVYWVNSPIISPAMECTSRPPLTARLMAAMMRRTKATARRAQRPLAYCVAHLLRLWWDEQEKAQ